MNSDRCQCRIIHGPQVEKARREALPPAENRRLALFFKAVADPTRLTILRALRQDEMCVCDLAALLGLSESAVSHQLRLLRQTALVANRREGPVLYYRLDDEHVNRLLEIAMEHIRE